eukprot:Tbor_TRINITY_DN4953_c2_g3::TRINITY_DN4953_c2_g3_i3::g.9796::m.9796
MITAGTLSTSLIDDGEAVKRPVDEFNWNLLPSSLTGLRQGPIEIGAGNPNVRRLHVFDNLRRPVVGPALSSSAKSDGQGRRSDAAREAGRTPRGDLSATSASEAARSRMGLKRRREM